ncbi:MAG: hypothetical protein BWY75_01880 [bacterium ADurb.Bin425]|nr:MAG: hypothetical protein BWY75_01880 [bacterium ADurb.Bin425]
MHTVVNFDLAMGMMKALPKASRSPFYRPMTDAAMLLELRGNCFNDIGIFVQCSRLGHIGKELVERAVLLL